MAQHVRRLCCVVATGAAIAVVAAEARDQSSSASHTVVVSVLDKNHVPVTGLQIGDFQISEAGKLAEIVSVNAATVPMRVAILDSDGGTGVFQLGALKFMQRLDGYAEFSLVSIIVQPITLVEYSTDGPLLSRALDAIGRRGNERGGQLMQAIDETTRTIRAADRRGVIVVLRIGGEETDTSLDPQTVRDRLRKSDAILDVIAVRGTNQPPPRTVSNTNGHVRTSSASTCCRS